jgi:hypothetical protein
MQSSASASAPQGRWNSLWIVAALSLLAHLWLCQFFTLGEKVPMSIDINPSNMWKYVYTFPPTGSFQVVNWLGLAYLPYPLNPCSLALHLPPWLFFTTYAPVMATCALLAMAAFLRELDLPRPAALFGGVIYAWQGDVLPFVFPGHYAYITTWPFFALAAWGALRAQRTRLWPYAIISGASCGLMVGLQPDRGALASLLIAALYLAPALRYETTRPIALRYLVLCTGMALLIALAAFLALFKGNIVGVTLGGQANRQQVYKLVTQYSLGPEETLSYLAPGFFGWHVSNYDGLYWGRIGRTLDWPHGTNSMRNLNLGISTTGTIATLLALIGIAVLLPGRLLGPGGLTERQRFFGLVLLTLGAIALVLSWGYHTPFYRPLFALPLMDKWRDPLKWLEMTNFALVVLSAFGANHLLASLTPDSADAKIIRRRIAWFCGVMIALLGFGILATYPFAVFFLKDYLLKASYEPPAVANMIDTMIASVRVAFILAGLFALLLWALWRPEPLRRFTLDNPLLHRIWQQMLRPESLPLTLALGLSALSVAQLAWVDTKFVEPVSLRLLTLSVPVLEKLKSEGPTVRVAVPFQDSVLNVLLQNQFYADRISCLDISAASRIPDDLNSFFNAFENADARLWFLAGVKNVLIMPTATPSILIPIPRRIRPPTRSFKCAITWRRRLSCPTRKSCLPTRC